LLWCAARSSKTEGSSSHPATVSYVRMLFFPILLVHHLGTIPHCCAGSFFIRSVLLRAAVPASAQQLSGLFRKGARITSFFYVPLFCQYHCRVKRVLALSEGCSLRASAACGFDFSPPPQPVGFPPLSWNKISKNLSLALPLILHIPRHKSCVGPLLLPASILADSSSSPVFLLIFFSLLW